jgi:hypothetical protein
MIHFIRASVFFCFGFIAQLLFIVTGLVVCLLPKRENLVEGKPFTQYAGSWFPVHLPKWAWL